jgi:hypothetical protein
MFRLLRFIFWTVVLIGFVYFALAVPLGKRTLAGHIVNIWRSPEGKELRQGTKEAAGPLLDKARRGADALRAAGGAPPPPPPPPAKPAPNR